MTHETNIWCKEWGKTTDNLLSRFNWYNQCGQVTSLNLVNNLRKRDPTL